MHPQVVLPRAQQALMSTWNPFSVSATRRAAAVLGDLLVYVPADSTDLQVQPCSLAHARHASLYDHEPAAMHTASTSTV